MIDARGFHHAYFGSALMLLGFFGIVFTSAASWLCVLTVLFGAVIFADDCIQHLLQRGEPSYRSPLNRWYGRTLWRVAWIRKVNEFVDRMLGRKA